MTFVKENRRFSRILQNGYPVPCVLLGLLAAQIIATAQVYFSNVDLQARLKCISLMGYLIIPNEQIMNRLQDFGPAFCGGLFFTLSLGVALSMLALGASWIWTRVFCGKKWFLYCLLMSWFLVLLLVNMKGFSPFVSAYFLFVPPIVFRMTRKLLPVESKRSPLAVRIIHPLLVILLGFLWTWQSDGNIFLSLRDNLLLTSAPGKKLNDFYYQYAFYPAEVFKSLNQKTLKTCRITGLENVETKKAVEKQLLENDYLPVKDSARIDLALLQEGKEILLQHCGKTVVRTTVPDFLAMAEIRLKEFSKRTDRYIFFRKFVFFSLLVGLPAMGYLFLFFLVRSLSGIFLRPQAAGLTASLICFGMGLTLLLAVNPGSHRGTPGKTLNDMLESDNRRERGAALKAVLNERGEIFDYAAYAVLLKSPHIPDRYWLAKTLAFSRNPETLPDLLVLLNDPSSNVVSMVYWALGRRGDKGVIPEILKRVPLSEDWYNQWYAYNALRNLEWMQTKLFSVSDCEFGSDPYLSGK